MAVSSSIESVPRLESRGPSGGHREIIGAGAWVVSSFILLSFANYVFSLVMSRRLTVEDYGSFGIISSVLLLEGLVATSGFPWMLSSTISRNPGSAGQSIRAEALGVALSGNVVVGLVTATAVGFGTARLVPHHPLIPFLAAMTAAVTCVNGVWNGLYQGERRFPLLAGIKAGEALFKVILGTTLVLVGTGLAGAIGGSAMAAFIVMVWGATRIRGFAWPKGGTWSEARNLRAVGWTATAQLGLALLMNMDILAVRGLSVGTSGAVGAGYYQAAVVLARAPVLVGLSVLSAIFPFLAREAANRVDEQRLLRMMVRILALGPIPIAIVLAAAPSSAIALFFPPSYAPAVPLLRLTSLAALPLITMAVLVTTQQATSGMKRAALAVLPAVALEAVLLAFLVPRAGAQGAAWASLLAASLGAISQLIIAPRRWASAVASPLPPIVCAWGVLACVSVIAPIPPHWWLAGAAALYVGFLLAVWALGGVALTEVVSLLPEFIRRRVIRPGRQAQSREGP